MKDQVQLINRAIAMHLLREGQFNVASSFIEEAAADLPTGTEAIAPDGEPDVDMDSSVADLPALLRPEELQSTFAEMYKILQEIKGRNLGPAIDWARRHSQQLEDRGSNLEFELCKLQFIWLFKGSSEDADQSPSEAEASSTPGSPSQQRHYHQSFDQANHLAALAYARNTFSRFQNRHLPEIRQLAAAMLYAPNLRDSPYAHIFASPTAFSDVSTTFTREFCSLLGLSAESPLYVAVTAGALALPQLMKYVARVAHRRTEWTTASELAFETPLPASMMYHSIFVCPVSKDQTTDNNPPMWLPGCGHVLARESLQNLAKGNRFKCPYCPTEGLVKDAKQIWL
jgi:E3 ubiquitin-protein transferase RMND5